MCSQRKFNSPLVVRPYPLPQSRSCASCLWSVLHKHAGNLSTNFTVFWFFATRRPAFVIPAVRRTAFVGSTARKMILGVGGSLVLLVSEDYWNVDGERELSDALTSCTRFILLNERPPDGYTSSGRRLTRKQTTSRPDDVWPDMWTHMSDAVKKKAKQRWAIENRNSMMPDN